MVGFLSQIGWTETSGDSPDKRIQMEKIFIDVDTNGGNRLTSRLHGKMPHRQRVIEKVYDYLTV